MTRKLAFGKKALVGAASLMALVISGAAGAEGAQAAMLDIEAQPLAKALLEFNRQTGVIVIANQELLNGKTAPAIRGEMAPEEALEKILSGSGLKSTGLPNGAYTVTLASAEVQGDRSFRVPQVDSQDSRRVETIEKEAAEEGKKDEVTVVGTRIKGARPASPVVTITAEEMRLSGQNNLGEVIRALPQNFGGGQNPGVALGATTGASLGNQNLTGSSALNLRGLGSDATLTLLNGTRLAYDGIGQAVDVSTIPVAAIKRMEILLDGASAIYGSDAVGGVANIVLKRDYEGAELSARFGAATEGGFEQQQYSAVIGTNWGSGGFLITGDYADNDPVNARHRDYLSYMPNQNVTIYPQSTQKSALFSGHQEIGDFAEFRVDALYAERSSEQTLQTSTSSFSLRDQDSSNWSVAPSLDFELPGEWSARLHGAFGRNEFNLGRTTFTVATGTQTSEFLSEYFNGVQAAGIELEGPLFALPGGDARASIGGGWRSNSFDQRAVDLVTGSISSVINAEENSYYVYGEVDLPLVSEDQNIPLMNRLTLNAAVRHENYDSFGGSMTPKIGAIWGLAPGFDLKASWGRSFKVPTLTQLHTEAGLQLYPAAWLGAVGAPTDAQAFYFSGGSPDLVPETSEVITAGFVARPEFLPDFTLEFGWFDIDYTNRTEQPVNQAAQALSNLVFAEFVTSNPSVDAQNAAFAAAGQPVGTFTFNGTGAPYDPTKVIAIIDNRYTNVASQRVKGIDLTARYHADLFGGDLSLSANGNWITEGTRKLTDLAAEQPTFGVNFWPAEFRGRLGASWSREGFIVNTSLNHTAGIIDRGVTPNVKRDGMTTVDLILDYQADLSLVGDVGVNLAVTNLFNEAPPFLQPVSGNQFLVNYDSTNYSVLGRIVSATVTKRF